MTIDVVGTDDTDRRGIIRRQTFADWVTGSDDILYLANPIWHAIANYTFDAIESRPVQDFAHGP